MLQRLRERLTLLFLALLPLHALLVTVGTKLLVGKGHAPLAVLALWKEALLGVILVLNVMEAMTNEKWKMENGKWKIFHFDVIDVLILALLILAIVVSTFNFQLSTFNFFLGFRYDFIPLVAFLVARRVQWSEAFQRMACKVLLGIGVIVSIYGILTAFLPMKFFLWLGYSPAHSLYFADGPLAAFQQVSETMLRRIQSTMSGPNQFGLWLLIPFSALLTTVSSKKRISFALSAAGLLLVSALFLTFSRAAWIAAFVMAMVVLCGSVPRRLLKGVAAGAVLIVVAIAVVASLLFPSVFFRLSSSRGHLVRPLQAIGRMIDHPLGEGLGAAGPASNRVSETCVFLRPQDDPSWAKTTPRLCVFLGSTQVQPADHACRCPFLPENWYLQIGVEMGVAGFVLFVALVIVVLVRLGDLRHKTEDIRHTMGSGMDVAYVLRLTSYVSFLGVSIAALFLHAWEDSAVSYTVWLLLAVQLHPSPSLRR
ncbi:MAG: O-antigen ligase family protein [Candidatus Peribacteraceae bacterium]|nr:O-antigen ligase family protein [Candidatus Peribacteraceae bacterium]